MNFVMLPSRAFPEHLCFFTQNKRISFAGIYDTRDPRQGFPEHLQPVTCTFILAAGSVKSAELIGKITHFILEV